MTFDRAVTVEADDGRSGYQVAGTVELCRLAPGQPVAVGLNVPQARRLRMLVHNYDDRPLTISEVTLWRVRRGLVFRAAPAAQYELWYGRRGAAEPAYDIQRLPLTKAPAELPLAALGSARGLPVKPPAPPPWSEQHPALFWLVLAVVVTLLGLLVLRAMRWTRQADRNA